MFSVAGSRYALPAQFLFLVLNGFGVLFGTIYNINTPDLYENNAHHKIGWIATWIVTAQVIMSLVFHYSGRGKQSEASTPERQAFLPVSTENMVQHNMEPYAECRWSGDSGQGTEASSTLNSRDASPTKLKRRNTDDSFGKPEPEQEPDDEGEEPLPARHQPQVAWLRINVIDKYLSSRVPNLLSAKILRAIEIVYQVIDRTILILGFIVLTTGVVTYAGMFVSQPGAHPLRRGRSRPSKYLADHITARKQRLQWTCTFYQRRNILLVWIVNTWTLDGVLCRVWLGMEPQADPQRGGPMESPYPIG